MISNKIDILGLNETWLNEDISNSSLSIPGYQLERADLPDNVRKHGVAFYIRIDITYQRIDSYIPNLIVVHLVLFNIYLINVYRPPSNSASDNENLIQFLNVFCTDKEVIIQGDFNLASIKWGSSISLQDMQPLHRSYYDSFSALGLTQVVNESTIYPSGNFLYLFLLSHEDRFGGCMVLPPFHNRSHCPILLNCFSI